MAKRVKEIKVVSPPNDRFGKFASGASYWMGSKISFMLAGLLARET